MVQTAKKLEVLPDETRLDLAAPPDRALRNRAA
jgi:hypothetical protein